MSDILKNHTALQEEGETVVSKTSSGKNKLSTYPTQRNLNQLVVVVHCPINALAQKEWKWWVWFLFALRYSNWKRRLTSTLAQCFQYFYCDSHFHIVTESVGGGQKNQSSKKTFFFFLPARCIRFSPSNSIINVLLIFQLLSFF